MKYEKKIVSFAKKLVQLSKDGDDMVTESRVSKVLAGLKQFQSRHYGRILKSYLEYISRELAAQTAVVTTPAPLGDEALKVLKNNFTSIYGHKVDVVTESDPSLIAGVRVRVGDDLYDASIAGRLKRFVEQVNEL